MTKSLLIFNKIVWLKFKNVPQSTISRSFNLFLMISMVVIMQLKDYLHDRSQGQFFTKANMLIMFSIGNVVKCSLLRPKLNILPLFNLVWWLQQHVAAVLLFLKQARSKI